VIELILYIILAIILDTLFVGLFRRRRGGKSKLIEYSNGSFRIQSEFGIIKYSSEDKFLRCTIKGKSTKLAADRVLGIKYRAEARYALLEELLFGFNIADFFARYQDSVDWYSISLIGPDDIELPIYIAGQYQPREFLLGWYIDMQRHFLEKVGLVTDIEIESRQLVTDLLKCLEKRDIRKNLL